MILVSLLYYQNKKKLYFDLTKNKMQNIVSTISSQIILSHMTKTKLKSEDFFNSNEYKISFYDKDKKKIFGDLNKKIDFSKKIISHKEHFILVDNSTYGHLNISYIAIEEHLLFKSITHLKEELTLIFLLIYSIISLIGFYLAKLFLQPIKEERIKLNNFIKDTTHELNTPISAILMSAESETLSRKQVQRVQLAAHRISEIYKDLTYVFLEDRENIQNIKELNLKQIIEEQLKYFEVIAEKKGISIKLELEDYLYKMDQNDFIRLFNNIVSNAIKYNQPKGSIHIKLNKNTLIIKDTGIGIQKEQLADIFKRYHRATKEQGGFGIGLNIVQNICLSYKIIFNVQSEIKKGTTFSFTF